METQDRYQHYAALARIYDALIVLIGLIDQPDAEGKRRAYDALLEMHKHGYSYMPPPNTNSDNDLTESDNDLK